MSSTWVGHCAFVFTNEAHNAIYVGRSLLFHVHKPGSQCHLRRQVTALSCSQTRPMSFAWVGHCSFMFTNQALKIVSVGKSPLFFVHKPGPQRHLRQVCRLVTALSCSQTRPTAPSAWVGHHSFMFTNQAHNVIHLHG